ncbi:MAG: hypothetical protein K0Q49_2305 [Haloplasmataceae bacterium]|jgi:hypothetical protein|nr:hypothetical protein [Haloplasmataceae bacterium]
MLDINLFELLSTINANIVIRVIDTVSGDIIEGCTDSIFSTMDYESLGRNVLSIKSTSSSKMIIEF